MTAALKVKTQVPKGRPSTLETANLFLREPSGGSWIQRRILNDYPDEIVIYSFVLQTIVDKNKPIIGNI